MREKKIAGIYWYWWIVALIFVGELIIFLFFGTDSYIGIHDNLDIHITDYEILKQNNAFFSWKKEIPFLGGIDRNYFLSELSLYALLYMIFPNFTAYITGYFLKILIALGSGILLGKQCLKEKYKEYEWAVVLGSFTYGLLPLYPSFSFSFSSLPLIAYLILQLEETGKKRYYIYVFFYPLLSYFTFFGPFIVGYICLYALVKGIQKKKIPMNIITAAVVLSLGYIITEYRLFYLIFIDKVQTIRDTMVMGNGNAKEVFMYIVQGFSNGIFHAEDVHQFVVLPVCILYFLWLNFTYIRKKEWKKILQDPFNILIYFNVFNCIIYGFYYWKEFREFVEFILPPLKGWQFNRTLYFTPLTWYAAVTLIAIRIYENRKKAAIILMMAVMLVPLGKQTLYNDFYNTIYTHSYELIKGKETESLSYEEFFSKSLFEEIKKKIAYQGEYAVAYGMHPAVLSYNGISTLDGVLSYYEQSYKEEFRRIISPALEKMDANRIYFDEWGARAYLYSGDFEAIWEPLKTTQVEEEELCINVQALREMNGKYIFSRIKFTNIDEMGIILVDEFSNQYSPYRIYVYKTMT